MGYNDYLYQYAPHNLQAAQAGYQSSKSRGNPMADIINTLVGAGVGFLTGGPTGAALGAGQALAGSQNPDVAGVGKAGIGGYQIGQQMGMRDRFATALQNSSMDEETKNILSVASQDPELGKQIFGQYAKSKMQAYDPMTLLMLKSMGIDPNKLGGEQEANEGDIVLGPDGVTKYKVVGGKLVKI